MIVRGSLVVAAALVLMARANPAAACSPAPPRAWSTSSHNGVWSLTWQVSGELELLRRDGHRRWKRRWSGSTPGVVSDSGTHVVLPLVFQPPDRSRTFTAVILDGDGRPTWDLDLTPQASAPREDPPRVSPCFEAPFGLTGMEGEVAVFQEGRDPAVSIRVDAEHGSAIRTPAASTGAEAAEMVARHRLGLPDELEAMADLTRACQAHQASATSVEHVLTLGVPAAQLSGCLPSSVAERLARAPIEDLPSARAILGGLSSPEQARSYASRIAERVPPSLAEGARVLQALIPVSTELAHTYACLLMAWPPEEAPDGLAVLQALRRAAPELGAGYARRLLAYQVAPWQLLEWGRELVPDDVLETAVASDNDHDREVAAIVLTTLAPTAARFEDLLKLREFSEARHGALSYLAAATPERAAMVESLRHRLELGVGVRWPAASMLEGALASEQGQADAANAAYLRALDGWRLEPPAPGTLDEELRTEAVLQLARDPRQRVQVRNELFALAESKVQVCAPELTRLLHPCQSHPARGVVQPLLAHLPPPPPASATPLQGSLSDTIRSALKQAGVAAPPGFTIPSAATGR